MQGMKKGFSLIELMVVIAIIAILAAIALPLYQDFTCKTRANEPLKQLADIKAGAAAVDGDFDQVFSDAAAISGNSTPRKQINYVFNAGIPDSGRFTFSTASMSSNSFSIVVAGVDAENPSCLAGFTFTWHLQRQTDNGGIVYNVQSSNKQKYVKTNDATGRI